MSAFSYKILTIVRVSTDIHPSCFAAAAFPRVKNLDVSMQPLWIHKLVQLDDLEKWLDKHSAPNDLFVMEACSNSFEICGEIKKYGRKAVVLESQRVGQVKKAYLKTDKEDAIKIAKIYLSGLAKEVWIPDEETRFRREVFLTYQKSVKDCTRYQNRIWAWLNEHGIVLKNKISLKKESGRQKIIDCYNWSVQQKQLLSLMIDDYLLAVKKRKELKKIMALEVTENPMMIKLLRLYGLSCITAYALVAIIGDISRFRNPKKLVAYIGLNPCVNFSGINGYTGSISRSGRRDIKSLLTQSAQAILNFAPNDHAIYKWGWKLSFRKNKNIALIGVARKLVVAVWYLLNGYYTELQSIPDMVKLKFRKLATNIGKEILKEMGYLNISNFVEVKGDLLMSVT